MDIEQLSKELIEQITNGASESDVMQLLTENYQALQLRQSQVSGRFIDKHKGIKTTIAELIEINNRNIERLKKLSQNETDRFYHGMLTYAQAFNLDLHHYKKHEKEIIDKVYENAINTETALDLTQGCSNEFCDNGKIEMPYREYISCSICENKQNKDIPRINEANISVSSNF